MPYTVRDVSDRRTMRDFLSLPDRIYKDDSRYVQPLKSEVRRTLNATKNPYFQGVLLHLLVCYDSDVPVGRIALVINPRHEKKFGVRAAFFGFFECIDDQAAANALFGAAKEYCRNHGATEIEGPFNPNHSSELGVLLDQHDKPPVFFQTYNPPYYRRLLEEAGFRISATMFTARNERVGDFVREHFNLTSPPVLPNGYTIRHYDPHRHAEEMETIRSVFNDAFEANWHFLPASREEYDFSAKFLHLITGPSLVCIAEHHGKPIGVVMLVLDINPLLRHFHGKRTPWNLARFLLGRKRLKTVIVYAVGIARKHQRTRVYPLLLEEAARMVAPFECAECTWMSEGNALSWRSAERLGMMPDKHFAIYRLAV